MSALQVSTLQYVIARNNFHQFRVAPNDGEGFGSQPSPSKITPPHPVPESPESRATKTIQRARQRFAVRGIIILGAMGGPGISHIK